MSDHWRPFHAFACAAGILIFTFFTTVQNCRAADNDYVVANTRPPDAFLALRTHPSSQFGRRIMAMPNGTVLQVLQRNSDGWWYVRLAGSAVEGWALSRQGDRVWIVCCAGSAANVQAPAAGDYTPVIGFKSPSNNVHCQLLEAEGEHGKLSAYLRCDLVEKANPSPSRPRDCDLDWGKAYSLARDEPDSRMICHGDTVFDESLQVLPYGSAWRQGGFNCLSERDGITCENRHGRGFRLSRSSQQIF